MQLSPSPFVPSPELNVWRDAVAEQFNASGLGEYSGASSRNLSGTSTSAAPDVQEHRGDDGEGWPASPAAPARN